MKLSKVIFFIAIASMMVFKTSFAGSVTTEKVVSPVAVDGLLEESFWESTNQISINLGGSDNSANFGVLWDDNYLYIGVAVVDGDICQNEGQGYYDDGVEICIDGNYSQGTTIDQYDRLFVKPVKSYWIQEKDGHNEGVIHQWMETNDGYCMEFAIPWDNFNVSPATGMSVGFNIAINDDDNNDNIFILPPQLLWNGNSNYYKDPSVWGTLNLSNQTISYSGDYIALISPNGDDFCINNKTTDINWVSNGITDINIDYSTDNGSSWNSIATNLSASSGSYNWNVSATPADQCLIKISEVSNSSLNDISESQFTISEALTAVEPLIPNIWKNYQWPYNAYFPEVSNGINGHIGNACGSTSLARILHYWEFPIVGNDELTFTDNWGNTWSANFGATTYNYDNMPDCLSENSTEAEYTDVATLVYHAATSMHDIGGSGGGFGNMSYVMSHYFNYKESATARRSNYTKAEWIQIMKNELDNGRVLLVAGITLGVPGIWHESGNASGHWYHCDGYNESGDFHVVVGYGDHDGYYDAESMYKFAYKLGILTGLEPDLNGKELSLLSPNGGELFSNIRETEITWNSSNISNLKVEYTTDNGKEWNQVIGSTPAGNDSYTWYLPEIVSDQCKIRLSDASDINIYDKSDGTFEIANDSLPLPSYFTNYDAFITKLTNLTSSTDSSAQLDQFWNELIATGNFPFAIDTEVAFLYRGSASTINWAGMFNNWDMNADAGNRLGISDVWILEKEFPADTRSGYKIVRNGSEWLADPNNPHPLIGEYGNSELWMPEYVIPPETIPRLGIPKGTLTDNILKFSTNLNYTSQYRVYTPANYNTLTNLPTIYVTDGQNYLDDSMGKMVIVLDNLIADEIIKPVITVFLDPRDPDNLSYDRRGSEYRNNINFANYVTQELIPDIDATYKTNFSADARAIMGASWGGYNAAYFCVKASEYFHIIGMNSPYLHPIGDYTIDPDLQAANLDEMKLYLSYGIFDADGERYFNRLKNIFDQKGKEFEYDIVSDGHTWQNWSGIVGDALEYFFAKSETVSLSLTFPNGGEYFIPGSTMNIKWNADLVSDIKIEFSSNNGSTWQEIIASTPASAQSFEWTVPDISSDQCLLKITDISDGTRYDESDSAFEIGVTNNIGGPYAVDDNTILLLHFENNLTNSSDLSDDGVAHGSGVSYSSSVNSSLGKCIKIDNSSASNEAYISIPHNENLNLSESWTIEAWFYLTSVGLNTAINPTILSKASYDGPSNYFVWYHNSWGSIKGQFTNSNNVDIYVGIGNNTITTGKWYHIAYIRNDAQNVHRLLIRNENREIIAQNESQYDESQSTPILNAEDVLIGKLFSPYSFSVDGYIDEVRISNIVRDFTATPVNEPPVVSNISDQTINEGSSFATIQLDSFVSDPDNSDSEITWSYTGNSELIVTIDGSRVASITTPNVDWNGSETITFTATDPEGASDSDDAIFTVLNDSLPLPYYFTNYDAFITKLTNLTSSAGSSAQLDQFWSDLIATGNFPFAIGTQVAFLYRGSASKINWAGEFNGWDMNADAGNCLGVSDVWILEKEFPADTKCEYKIVRNGSEWLADPHNPHPLVGDFQNSELWMPEYEIPSETIRNPDAPRGTLSNNILTHSSYLGYTCQYRVYTPANYNSLTNLPVIYCTDGQNYLNDSMGKMVIILDNLIFEGTIEPVIAVFLDPRDPNNLSNDRRCGEYLYNPKFADYVSKELIPDIDAAYKTNPSADVRAILGASYGACNAAYFCVQLPDYFHLIGMQSPWIHPNDYDVISELRSSDLEPMKLFMSTGTLNDAEMYCDRLRTVFDQKGKEYEYKTLVAGHTWSNWSQLVDDVLIYFYSTEGDVEVALSGDFDGDGQVGLGDFSMFVRYYGLSKGHGDFDVLYDLDGNGQIGLGDFSIFAGNYGRRIGTGKVMPVMVAKNGEGALSTDIVDEISGDVNLTVRLEGVRAPQGYSFNVRYAPDRFDFRGAERVGTDFSDNGSQLWPLLVMSPRPGEIHVADVFKGDEVVEGGGMSAELCFRCKGSPEHVEFTVTEGIFMDADGELHALESAKMGSLPQVLALLQAFPNPFNASTAIRIQLPEASEVRLRVYNLLGQEVRRLIEGKVKAGAHSILWDGRNSQGRTLASGMYLVRLEVGAFAQLRKLVLLR